MNLILQNMSLHTDLFLVLKRYSIDIQLFIYLGEYWAITTNKQSI